MMTELTQEIIEELFYDFIKEMRDQNIPILNDFHEVFAHVKYESESKSESESKKNKENKEDDKDDGDDGDEITTDYSTD